MALSLMLQLADRSEEICHALVRGDGAQARAHSEACDALRGALTNAPALTPSALTGEQLGQLKEAVGRIKHAEATFAKWQAQAQPVTARAASRPPEGAEQSVAELLERWASHDYAEFLQGPTPYTNSAGQPLGGYDAPNMARAALHLVAHGTRGRYDEALQGLDELEAALRVERLGLEFERLVLPEDLWRRRGQAIDDGQERSPIKTLILRLYEGFLGEDVATIEERLSEAIGRGQERWNQTVPDEDHPTFEQLSAFYNGQEFPEGDMMPEAVASRLACAHRMIPVRVALELGAKSAFDYGGGSGLTTSALAAAGLSAVTLIEENVAMLEFAAWRDREAGIEGVSYLRESALCDDLEARAGSYDFGVCTEVLEHVLDVEGTIARMARLVRPGGLLFQSASFALYPHLSHLKPNIQYAGREDELMAQVGFERVPLEAPVPMLANQRLYRRS